MDLFQLIGKIVVDNSEANANIDETNNKAESFGSKLQSGISTAAKWGTAIVGGTAAAAGGMVKLAENAASTGDNIDKMSQKIGISRQAYQELDFICSQSGTSVDGLQAGMKSLVSAMDKAASGTEANVAMFEQLGISVVDSNGNMRDSEEVMWEAFNALQSMENQTEKSRLAVKLFGRSGTELMPLLNGATGSIDEMKQQAHDLGLVLSDEFVDNAVNVTDSLDQTKRAFAAIGTQLMGSLMPIVEKASDYLQQSIPYIQEIISQLIPVIMSLLEGILPPLMQLGQKIFPVLINLINTLLPVVTEIITNILPIITELLIMLLPPIVQIVNDLLPLLLALIEPLLPLLEPILKLLEPLLQLVMAFLEPLIQLLNQILPPIIEYLSTLFQNILPYVDAALRAVADVLTGVFSKAFENLQPLIQNIIGIFNGLIDFVSGVFTGNWEKAWNGIKDIFGNVFEGIKELFKIPINWIIDGINSFIEGINSVEVPDWVPLVGGKSFNIPMIPKLNVGMDYVPYDNYPAYLHKGETVLTSSEAEEYRNEKESGYNKSPIYQFNDSLIKVEHLEINSDDDIDSFTDKVIISIQEKIERKDAESS